MTSSTSAPGSNPLGVATAPLAGSWSASELLVVLGQPADRPDQESNRLARQARHRLSLFWLASPGDLLEQLYASDLGEVQRLCIRHPQLEGPLLVDEQLWRQQLQALLQTSVGQATFVSYWLALMPYLKVGELRLDQPETVLPSWLLDDYRLLCEPNPCVVDPLPLTRKRGDDAIRWLQEETVLARAVVLLNGFQLDPEAPAQAKELADLRSVVAQVWLDIAPEQLQGLFESPLGLLTRSLVKYALKEVYKEQLDDLADDAARAARLLSLTVCEPAMGSAAFLNEAINQLADKGASIGVSLGIINAPAHARRLSGSTAREHNQTGPPSPLRRGGAKAQARRSGEHLSGLGFRQDVLRCKRSKKL